MILHAAGCEDAPKGDPAMDVLEALDYARMPGVILCKECGVPEFLDRFLDPS
ncbi:DUF6233 domain-containing protein [Streptomyces sp. NPDC090106]|uniref:DUF6233 domain-containing protein n=1 Tax=Streptomyces sp. NPDC090106 TaxID=3365946 RepID=UPI0037FA1FBF